jgi:hypothetical protein
VWTILAAGVPLVFNFVNVAAAARPTNFCLLTSAASDRSCQAGAQSDYWACRGQVRHPFQRRDWFCQDTDGNVWYFGENANQITEGLIVGVEGSWTGGVDGAKPGIAMEAHPAVSDVYRQEYLPDVVEDMGEVLSLTESVTVPFGSFSSCLKTKDTSPLEPGTIEQKMIAAIAWLYEINSM